MSRPAHGLNTWLLQRVSALYLAAFVLYLLAHFLLDSPADYVQWRAWVAQPLVSTAFGVAAVMLVAHVWVGVRDVLMDYVHSLSLRIVLLASVAFGLLASVLWTLWVLVRVVSL